MKFVLSPTFEEYEHWRLHVQNPYAVSTYVSSPDTLRGRRIKKDDVVLLKGWTRRADAEAIHLVLAQSLTPEKEV